MNQPAMKTSCSLLFSHPIM